MEVNFQCKKPICGSKPIAGPRHRRRRLPMCHPERPSERAGKRPGWAGWLGWTGLGWAGLAGRGAATAIQKKIPQDFFFDRRGGPLRQNDQKKKPPRRSTKKPFTAAAAPTGSADHMRSRDVAALHTKQRLVLQWLRRGGASRVTSVPMPRLRCRPVSPLP